MENKQLSPLPVEQWSDQLEHVIADMQGEPINVHKLMAHNPGLLKAWWDFRNYSVAGGSLGKRLGELVILRTAIHMQAWYEWASHVERALACGITASEIDQVKQRVPGPDWADHEGLLLQAVDQLMLEQRISVGLMAQLHQYFSQQQVMDIIAIHGMYVILGNMINTWGLALDESVRDRLPPAFTDGQVPRLE